MPDPLVLASRSPQRRAILEQLGVEFTVVPADIDEETSGEPGWLVIENALRKARAVAQAEGPGVGASAPGERVRGVDTDVFLDGRVFGKPRDTGDARAMLLALAGRTHEVWSGIALREDGAERTSVACTKVRFGRLGPSLLDWYLDSGEWEGRAGGYAIQGRGATLVEAIEGDFWNVVGLPVPDLLELAPDLFRPRPAYTPRHRREHRLHVVRLVADLRVREPQRREAGGDVRLVPQRRLVLAAPGRRSSP